MTLKYLYSTKEEIPAGAESFYTEKDGNWVLQVEGVKTQEDVDRAMAAMDKQKQLRIDAERELAKFKDVDLEKWEKLKDYDPDADPGTDKDVQKRITEAVRKKEQELQDQYRQKEEATEAEKEAFKNKMKKYVKDSWIRKMLSEKFGFTDPRRLNDFIRAMRDESDPDFMNLQRLSESIDVLDETGSFSVVGGDLKDEKGAKEVLEKIAASEVSKHYMPAAGNQGGGSGGGGTPPAGSGSNPYKKETFNLTEQAKLEATDLAKAKALAEAAGVKI